MSTVVDISPLVALESQAPVEAPAVGIPGSDLPERAAEPKVEEKSSEAETSAEPEKDSEKAPEAKIEGSPKALPSQKAIHETLKEFFKEATQEGKEKLQKLNSEIRDLYAAHRESLSASKDIEAVTTSAKELQDLVQAADSLVYAGDPQIVENIYEDVLATNGNAESFDKLVPAFVEKLRETNPEKYYSDHVAPLYAHALETTGMTEAVR